MEYYQIDEKYSIFEFKSCDYHVKSLIDTRFVDTLKLFKWRIPKSKDPNRKGTYFIANVSSKLKSKYNCIIKQSHLIFMHELIAFLSLGDKPSLDEKLTVDHINRETLDNRSENLRWATILQQNRNRNRKENRTIPPGIPELPMYVTWNSGYEVVQPSGNKILREFFRIEKHPALPTNRNYNKTIWSSSKHHEVSIHDKYKQTLEKLKELDSICPSDNSINELRDKNYKSYCEIMNITPKEVLPVEEPVEETYLKRDNIEMKIENDILYITHESGNKIKTNAKFFKDLKTFSIYPDNNKMIVSVLKKHKEQYNITSNSKTPIQFVIMHLDKQYCQNDNKKMRFVCHKNEDFTDCRIENLYWGSKTQQQMCKEKKLITNLPKDCGIQAEDIPKYIYYHAEPREHFFITHHPSLEEKKKILSSTSKNKTTLEKYNEILEKLNEL